MKALVSGGAGFIGSHLVSALLERNYDVVVLDSLVSRVHGPNAKVRLPKDVRFLQEDVRDKHAWEKALDGVNVVFHEAAYQDYMADYSTFFHSNVVSTALLYEVIRERHLEIEKVVVASSQAVYGEGQYECASHGKLLPSARSQQQMKRGDWELRCSECHEILRPILLKENYPNPFNQYALSKYSQEMAALRLGRSLGIPTVALRYSITQGPRQSLLNQYSGVLRIFLRQIKSGKTITIYEDGLQTRDFVHIQDVVEANLKVLEDVRANYEAYNVGSGNPTTILEYASRLLAKMQVEVRPLVTGEFREGDNRHSVSSVNKLQALGWSPKRNLDKIMEDFLAWIEELGPLPSEAPAAEDAMRLGGVLQASLVTGSVAE